MSSETKIRGGAVLAAGVVGIGGYLLYKWLNKETLGSYEHDITDANMQTDKWLMSGIKSADDLRDIVESQGAQLQEMTADEGYVLVHDMAGFPVMSRMYVQDALYLSDKIKDVSLFSKVAARFSKANNYLHVVTFRLPDISTEDYEYWVIFFSNEREFSKDPSFLTNMGHSWTVNSDWKRRFKNRSSYNQVTYTLKEWLAAQGVDLETWYKPDEIKRFYEQAKTEYANKLKPLLKAGQGVLQDPKTVDQMANDQAKAWLNPDDVDYYVMVNHSQNSLFGQSLRRLREKQLLGSTARVYYGERLPGDKDMSAVSVTLN